MDILGVIKGFSIEGIVSTAILGGASAILAKSLYAILKSVFNPVEYIHKLYQLADKAIERVDDGIVDKYIPKGIKEELQSDIISALEDRKTKIEELIVKISD